MTSINITIRTVIGSKITLSVSNDLTVSKLKNQIEKKLGFAPNEQKLIFKDNVLDEHDRKLRDYGIADGSAISFLFCPRNFDVGMQFTNGKVFKVEVDSKDTITQVKSKLLLAHSISIDDYVMVYQGKQINKDDSLSSLGITDHCVINLIPRARNIKNGIRICAKTMDGKTANIEICKNESVINMKKKLEGQLEILPCDQRIVFQGVILEDERTLDQYQIMDKSIVHVVARLRRGIQIFVRVSNRGTVTCEVFKHEKIIDLKKIIEQKLGLAPCRQLLTFDGEIMEDHRTVEECHMEASSLVLCREMT